MVLFDLCFISSPVPRQDSIHLNIIVVQVIVEQVLSRWYAILDFVPLLSAGGLRSSLHRAGDFHRTRRSINGNDRNFTMGISSISPW